MNTYKMRKKIIPYATQTIDDQDIKAVGRALKADYLTQGPLVEKFEEAVAEYCGSKYAVAVNSGTSALHLACLAAGISKGDEVITSPITFLASANCILYCGGKPVFADIQAETINIDPKEIEKNINARTKAIIPVHFAGNPCELEEIYSIAKKNDLFIIEDAAHALGATYRGAKIGSGKYSHMTILSFHAVKHITTGEGGMILTNNKELYEKMKRLRTHGITRNTKTAKNTGAWYYEMQSLGFNYRLTDIQCALGISQLKKLDRFLKRRRKIATMYNKAFASMGKIKVLKETAQAQSAWHLYVIQTAARGRVFKALREKGINVNVHYVPVYKQPYYQQLGYDSELCPRAEAYYEKAISIPMYPKMTDNELGFVIEVMEEMLGENIID